MKKFVCSVCGYVYEGAGQLVQIKENSEKKLEDYKEEYGSDAYGIAAYRKGGEGTPMTIPAISPTF